MSKQKKEMAKQPLSPTATEHAPDACSGPKLHLGINPSSGVFTYGDDDDKHSASRRGRSRHQKSKAVDPAAGVDEDKTFSLFLDDLQFLAARSSV
jgi:hypothetical protein